MGLLEAPSAFQMDSAWMATKKKGKNNVYWEG